jgi:hypothetical protein
MEKISPPVRIFAILLVLLGLAGMLAMRTMGPSAANEAAALPVVTPRAKPTPKAPAAAKPIKTAAAAKPATAAAKPAKAPALNAPKPAARPAVPPSGFPLAVDAALRKYEVLVVSLVVPGARVDELAAAEAQAGAKLGGAGYLALNVLNEDVAHALLTKLSVLADPGVLVLKRSGEVALELAGFVDRETVAQAAANASS